MHIKQIGIQIPKFSPSIVSMNDYCRCPVILPLIINGITGHFFE